MVESPYTLPLHEELLLAGGASWELVEAEVEKEKEASLVLEEDGHDVFGESHRCRDGGASSACDVGFAGRLFKGIEYVNELITLQ